MWKILGTIIALMLVISGCAYKSQSLYFDPYIPTTHAVSSNLALEKVYLKSVIDMRQSPQILATIIDSSGSASIHATSGEAVPLWVYDALKTGLEARGIATVSNPQEDAKTLVVELKKLHAKYDENIFKSDNLHASMTLRVQITKDKKTVTKNISQKSFQWHKPIKDTIAFKPILQELMQDVVERTVAEVITF